MTHYERKFVEGRKIEYQTSSGETVTIEMGEFLVTPVDVTLVVKHNNGKEIRSSHTSIGRPYRESGIVLSSGDESYEFWRSDFGAKNIGNLEVIADEIEQFDANLTEAIDILNNRLVN